ncbi:hypothetical protein ABWH92_08100 [Ahrensia marina]|uniref:hypothetical protein n=1 Tax=Ahrensia marina TaxID=1514904 RepID=UPI0035CF8F65
MAIVILFVFAGPALGGITGGVALAGAMTAGSETSFGDALLGFFPAAALFSLYGAIFGYWLGFLPALAAGLVIAWHEGWRGPVTGFSAALLGMAVGALYFMFSEFFGLEAGAYGAAFGVLVCVVPCYVLWRVVRFWGRSDPPAALPSSREAA